MLKIAEYNTITGEKVELKELENYGFRKGLYGGYTSYPRTHKECAEIIIENDRIVEINPFGENDVINCSLLDTLYDLIKDGFIIKED